MSKGLDWINRVLCWATGAHLWDESYMTPELGTRPVCKFCEQDIWGTRCSGWAKRLPSKHRGEV